MHHSFHCPIPDITFAELSAVETLLCSPQISNGQITAAFEHAFAAYLGRKYAVAVSSGTIGLLLALRAFGIGPGHEVIASPYSFRETAHAISLAGARAVFAEIDYWSGALVPASAEERITAKTRAIVAGNPNGHPAPWSELRAVAQRHQLMLLEDSTEAIGSSYKGELVGRFGDIAVFDFAQPLALTCGEGGMVVTDDIDIALGLRRHRAHRLDERSSVVVGSTAPYQAGMSDLTATLGLAQLKRLDEILERRRFVEQLYNAHMQSFEGIKPPYVGPDVVEVNWLLYLVHLGRASRDRGATPLSMICAARRLNPPPIANRYTCNNTTLTSAIGVAISWLRKESQIALLPFRFTPISRTSRSSLSWRP